MSDYLFDRRGRDPEVEDLEQVMGALKFDQPPPSLGPAPVVHRGPAVPAPRRERDLGQPIGSIFTTRRTPLFIALALGAVAGVVSYSAIQRQEMSVRKGWNLVPVVVASVDLSEGTVLTTEMISQRSIPEQFVTSSVVKPDSASYIVNQKVLVPVQAGDPLLWSQFETTRAAERLSAKLAKRSRAVAIETKGTAAVGGFVRPNDHVDILGTFKDPGTGEQVAVTLMQNVVVVATGKITGTTNINLIPENQRDYGNVSLMVLPEEAEVLTLSQQLGALALTLRNEEDIDLIEERGRATINTLLSGERTKVLQQKRFNTIQVIRGAATKDDPAR